MNGYIKLFRQLMDNPLWLDKPFAKGQAWIDLLMLANWKESKRVINNGETVLHEGEIIVSQAWLAERWGWSRKKVSCFLTFLEHSGNIRILGTSKGTALHIENYTKYQSEGTGLCTSKEHLKNIKRAHIKNIKTIYKDKNISKREIYKEKSDADLFRMNHELFSGIKARLAEEV